MRELSENELTNVSGGSTGNFWRHVGMWTACDLKYGVGVAGWYCTLKG